MLDGARWTCSDHTIVNEDLFFVCGSDLIRTNLNTYETRYVNDNNLKNAFSENFADYITAVDKTLYTISWKNTCILRINLKDNSIKKIYEDNDARIQNLEPLDNSFFVFFRNRGYYLKIIGDNYEKHISPLDNNVLYKSVRVNDEVWFVEKNGNKYFKCSLKTNDFIEEKIPVVLNKCVDIKHYNGRIYFLCENEMIIKDETENIKFISLDKKIDSSLYGMIIPLKNKVFVLPGLGDDILEIDYTGKVTTYNDYPEGYHYTQPDSWLKIGTKYYTYEMKDNIHYFPRRATNYMLTIDGDRECINWVAIKEPELDEQYKHDVIAETIINEKNGYLNKFIEQIKKSDGVLYEI